jgi:hypothetical protein
MGKEADLFIFWEGGAVTGAVAAHAGKGSYVGMYVLSTTRYCSGMRNNNHAPTSQGAKQKGKKKQDAIQVKAHLSCPCTEMYHASAGLYEVIA